jgi:hypothetical protein
MASNQPNPKQLPDTVDVHWDAYTSCPGTTPESDDHTCPMVVYANIDGTCSHRACEGRHEECGQIVALDE